MSSRGVSGRWGLPLLARELTEMAARRRTYIIRVTYVLVLLILGFAYLYNEVYERYGNDPFKAMGSGRQLFDLMVYTQFFGVYLVLPAITCGAIALEKESSTLQLLLLTRLSPWTIVFEKLLSRLVPMVLFLAASLPMLAIAYSFGGVHVDYLFSAVWLLAVGSLQTASIALACSAWARTTAGAFVGTFVVGCAICFALPIVNELFHARMAYSTTALFFPPGIFDRLGGPAPGAVMEASLPSLLIAAAALITTRLTLISRADLPSRNRSMDIVHNIDRFAVGLFRRVSRNRLSFVNTESLPENRPVAWRESAHGMVSLFRHRVVLSLVILAFWVLIEFLIQSERRSGNPRIESMAIPMFIFLGMVAAFVCIRTATLFPSERSRQTLDILLSTPIPNRELVAEKADVVRRWIVVFVPAWFAMLAIECVIKPGLNIGRSFRFSSEFSAFYFVVSMITTVVIYLHLIHWISMIVGLRARNPLRAILGSLTLTGVLGLGAFVMIVPVFDIWNIGPGDSGAVLLLSTPLPYLIFNETNEVTILGWPKWLLFALNTGIYGTLWYVLRTYCLVHVDRTLDRKDRSSVIAPSAFYDTERTEWTPLSGHRSSGTQQAAENRLSPTGQ